MLKQRIITALILLPLVVALVFLVPLDYFVTIILIVTYLIALEWAKLAGFKQSFQCSLYALAVSSFNLAVWYFAGDLNFWPSLSWPHQLVWDLPLVVLAISVVAIVIAVLIVLTYSTLPKWWANLPVRFVLGFAMLPAFFVSLVCIRNINYIAGDFYFGGQLLLMMFSMIWAADTGAYFTGKAFGKTKLAENVSPNKTWEGVIGGMFLSFTFAWLGAYLLNLDIKLPVTYSIVALVLAATSVLGDLFESALKRVANIKDSGNLLPGHGGIYDRLDSSIVVAPLFYLVYSYHGWY